MIGGVIEFRDCMRECLLSELSPGGHFQISLDGERFYRGFDDGKTVACFDFDSPRISDYGDFRLDLSAKVYEVWQEFCDENGRNVNDKNYPYNLPSPYLIN